MVNGDCGEENGSERKENSGVEKIVEGVAMAMVCMDRVSWWLWSVVVV